MAPVQIFVKGFKGETTTVNLPNVDVPIDKLFDEYAALTGLPVRELRLLYQNHELRRGENKTLDDFGMQNLSNVFAVARLKGGHNPFQQLKIKKKELKDLPGFVKVTTTEECMITLDDDPSTKKAKMPCGHVISPIGMTHYCKSLLDAKRFTFPCPFVGTHDERCTATWEFLLVKHVCVLDEEELRTIESKLVENYARRGIGVQQCPGCQTYCSRTNSHDRVVRCVVCSKRGGAYDFCWSCLQRASSHKRCDNSECDGRDPRLRFLQVCPKKEVVKVPDCPSVRACVQCGSLIEHTAACKHMTCIACKTEFCFICLKKRVKGKWQCGSHNTQCKPAPVQTQIPGQ